MVVEVQNWRWAGVPIRLRSGKALASRRREIVITFRPPTHVPREFVGGGTPDRLRIAIAPDEMSLELNVNGPGDSYDLSRATLHAEFGLGDLTAYGEVLAGILDGDPTLSVRGDSAVEGWRIVAPVLDAWTRRRRADRRVPGGHGRPVVLARGSRTTCHPRAAQPRGRPPCSVPDRMPRRAGASRPERGIEGERATAQPQAPGPRGRGGSSRPRLSRG